jgi:hypothetical protein
MPAASRLPAEVGCRAGAEQRYASYRVSGLTLEEFEGARYQRIGHVKKLMAAGTLDSTLRRSACEAARAAG